MNNEGREPPSFTYDIHMIESTDQAWSMDSTIKQKSILRLIKYL